MIYCGIFKYIISLFQSGVCNSLWSTLFLLSAISFHLSHFLAHQKSSEKLKMQALFWFRFFFTRGRADIWENNWSSFKAIPVSNSSWINNCRRNCGGRSSYQHDRSLDYFFKSTAIKLIAVDNRPGKEFETGKDLIHTINKFGTVAGVLLYAVPQKINMAKIFKGMADIEFKFPVFGGGAGVYNSEDIPWFSPQMGA